MVSQIRGVVLHVVEDKLVFEARWIELAIRLISLDVFLLTTLIAGVRIGSALVGINALRLRISWRLFKTVVFNQALLSELVHLAIFARCFLLHTCLIDLKTFVILFSILF